MVTFALMFLVHTLEFMVLCSTPLSNEKTGSDTECTSNAHYNQLPSVSMVTVRGGAGRMPNVSYLDYKPINR